jgi:integrase
VERARAGIHDVFEPHRKRPLLEHLEDWRTSLLADGASEKHVRQTVACARRVLSGCHFVFIADLSASRVQEYLASLRKDRQTPAALDPAKEWYTKNELAGLLGVKAHVLPPLVKRHRLPARGNGKARRFPKETAEALLSMRRRGRSVKTSNLYLDAVKGFCAWLVKDRRTADNPLALLAGGNVKLDRRHDRQTLSIDRLAAVLKVAASSQRTFRGLTGADRHALYLCAMGTGFRASELASLRPESFDLNAAPPTATVAAACTKNKRLAVQPLPPDVVQPLRGYLASREPGNLVWGSNWHDNAADMLRIDLEAASVSYVIEGLDGPLYADFHSLRHSYIALLDKAGVISDNCVPPSRVASSGNVTEPEAPFSYIRKARCRKSVRPPRRTPTGKTWPGRW